MAFWTLNKSVVFVTSAVVIVFVFWLILAQKTNVEGNRGAAAVASAPAINKASVIINGIVTDLTLTEMVEKAFDHPRKRKMFDLTKDPLNNDLQVLVNSYSEGSYSPVHMHKDYDEVFSSLEGSLAFFTFDDAGLVPTCHIITSSGPGARLMVMQRGKYHAMTAAPRQMGYPGHAVVLETAAHKLQPHKVTKFLSPHFDTLNNGLDGIKSDFDEFLKLCPQVESEI